MKKDIFNGKVKSEYIRSTRNMIVFAGILLFAIAAFFVLLGIYYYNVDYAARIALFVMSGVFCFLSVFAPLTTVLLIRKYPKYKKLTRLFIESYVFNDTDNEENKDNDDL